MGDANSLTDSNATFYTTDDGLKGVYVEIIAGTGVGERKLIVSNTKTTLTFEVKDDWDVNPDTTSVYNVGNIDFRAKGPILSGKDFRQGWEGKTLSFSVMVVECTERAATYSVGRVTLTNGSTAVVGVADADGTKPIFTTAHIGENFFVPGIADKEHFVATRTDATHITLTASWAGQTGNYAFKIGAKLLKILYYLDGSGTVFKTVFLDMASSPAIAPIWCKAKSLQIEMRNNRAGEPVTINSYRVVEPKLVV